MLGGFSACVLGGTPEDGRPTRCGRRDLDIAQLNASPSSSIGFEDKVVRSLVSKRAGWLPFG